MLGKGHMGTGFAAASYLIYFDSDPIFIGTLATGIVLGSVFPDRSETIGPIRLFKHRGITHWLGLWVILLGIFYYLFSSDPRPLNEQGSLGLIYLFLTGLSAGSIVHILGDLPNYQKIPILTPRPSFSLGFWKSGQFDALIVLILFLPHLYFLKDSSFVN